MFYFNGARLYGDFMKKVVDAGIDFIRFSIIGYNKEKYKQWMNIDNFDLIKKNIHELVNYIRSTNSDCKVSTYHLITDNNEIENEIVHYKNNVINELNVTSYIWKMHNWSGNFSNPNPKKKIIEKILWQTFCARNNNSCWRCGWKNGSHGALLSNLEAHQMKKKVYWGT